MLALRRALYAAMLVVLASCAGRQAGPRPSFPGAKASITLTRSEIDEMLSLMNRAEKAGAAQRKEWMACEADGCILEGRDEIVYASPLKSPGLKWKASLDLQRWHAVTLVKLMDAARRGGEWVAHETDRSRVECGPERCKLMTRGPKGTPRRYDWISRVLHQALDRHAR